MDLDGDLREQLRHDVLRLGQRSDRERYGDRDAERAGGPPDLSEGIPPADDFDRLGITTYQPPSHFDKTPFLWHGDTAWAASTQACRNQWRDYVDNRRDNGFTVVHLALAPSWAGQLATGSLVGPLNEAEEEEELVVEDAGAWTSSCKIDGMVQYANQQGLTVYIPGLIQPYQEWPSTEAVKVFTRNFVGRMRGYAVILSPGFDSDPDACEPGGCARKKLALMDAAGTEARSVDPAYPLLINHFATVAPGKVALAHPKTWLNADGYQSGFSDAKLPELTNRPAPGRRRSASRRRRPARSPTRASLPSTPSRSTTTDTTPRT